MKNLFRKHPLAYSSPTWRGVCSEVTDGDTYQVVVDCGFNMTVEIALRLRDVDTAEIFVKAVTPEEIALKEHGFAAKARCTELLLNQPMKLQTFKDRKTFGRYVADVWFWSDDKWNNLADTLVAEGLAKRGEET